MEATATAAAAAESPEGGLGNLIRKGEEGEEGEEEQDDEAWDDFKWAKVSVNASGAGEIMDVLLQNIDDEGENPGEFETATETDIFKASKEKPRFKNTKKSKPRYEFFLN